MRFKNFGMSLLVTACAGFVFVGCDSDSDSDDDKKGLSGLAGAFNSGGATGGGAGGGAGCAVACSSLIQCIVTTCNVSLPQSEISGATTECSTSCKAEASETEVAEFNQQVQTRGCAVVTEVVGDVCSEIQPSGSGGGGGGSATSAQCQAFCEVGVRCSDEPLGVEPAQCADSAFCSQLVAEVGQDLLTCVANGSNSSCESIISTCGGS